MNRRITYSVSGFSSAYRQRIATGDIKVLSCERNLTSNDVRRAETGLIALLR
jgi:hypothetical protein